jgi:hypothetical protein
MAAPFIGRYVAGIGIPTAIAAMQKGKGYGSSTEEIDRG